MMIPEISVFHRAYDSFGGHPVFGLAGDYVELRLREAPEDYGAAVREIHVTLWLRTVKAGPRRTLEDLFAEHHRKLDRLPRVVFHRSGCRVEIDYETRLVPAETGVRAALTPELFHGAVREIAGQLPLISKPLQRLDDFDADRFLSRVQAVAAEGTPRQQDLARIQEQSVRMRTEQRAAKDPWELLDIDWSEYHRSARRILNDPWFWDCVDEYAPHGNDTGADVLEYFRERGRSRDRSSSLGCLQRMLRDWDVPYAGPELTDAPTLRKYWETDWEPVLLWDEAIVGLAFAELKLTGQCNAEVRRLALLAVERELLPFREGWIGASERQSALQRIQAKLKDLAA